MAAMTSFHAEQCCHLLSAHAASARQQFLIRSTFKLVLIQAVLLLIIVAVLKAVHTGDYSRRDNLSLRRLSQKTARFRNCLEV